LASPVSDLERRLNVVPLEELHAERDTLVKQLAPLWARHGPGGSYEALRKIQWTSLAVAIRAQAQLDGVKLTESAIEQMAHADAGYGEWVAVMTLERATFKELETRIQAIEDTIHRGNAIVRFLASEAQL
jgi:hypothetical protein